jgi:hypothetical protein
VGVVLGLIGLILLPCPIMMICKNQQKQVTYNKFVKHIERNTKMVTCEMPSVADNGQITLVTGKCFHALALVDQEFGVFAADSYHLRRTVKMFQW